MSEANDALRAAVDAYRYWHDYDTSLRKAEDMPESQWRQRDEYVIGIRPARDEAADLFVSAVGNLLKLALGRASGESC